MRSKTALITGAARGIGLATAQLMTARGYRVAMVDRDVDELNAVVTSLDQAEAFFCDVSVPEETAKTVKSVLDWTGRIGVVVCVKHRGRAWLMLGLDGTPKPRRATQSKRSTRHSSSVIDCGYDMSQSGRRGVAICPRNNASLPQKP